MSWIAIQCDEPFKLKVNEYLRKHKLNNKEFITELINKAMAEGGIEISPMVRVEKVKE